MPKTETRTCLDCSNRWTRTVTRGAKPSRCPDCRKAYEQANYRSPEETLTCKECGQDWTRKRAKGKKPSLCPTCRPQSHSKARSGSENAGGTIPPGTPGSASDAFTENLSGTSEFTSKVTDDMLEILTSGDYLEPEWKRKADYVVEVLDNPKILARRDPLDTKLMIEVQKDLVRQHHMRLRLAEQARQQIRQLEGA